MGNIYYVIVTGGNVNKNVLTSWLEQTRNVYIIAVDKGLETIKELNIKPDCIMGDFDSVDEDVLNSMSNSYVNEHIIRYNPKKDYTDTELAIRYAIDNGADRITIFGATGTRIDHMLANLRILYLAYKQGIFAEIIDEYNKIYLINKETTLVKSDMYGKYVSLLPFKGNVKGITLKGFKYDLNNHEMSYESSLGISNEILLEKATITYKDGQILVVESRDSYEC